VSSRGALLPADRTQAAFLTERLLTCRIEQLAAIRDMLETVARRANGRRSRSD
jgi:hypothetical protein